MRAHASTAGKNPLPNLSFRECIKLVISQTVTGDKGHKLIVHLSLIFRVGFSGFILLVMYRDVSAILSSISGNIYQAVDNPNRPPVIVLKSGVLSRTIGMNRKSPEARLGSWESPSRPMGIIPITIHKYHRKGPNSPPCQREYQRKKEESAINSDIPLTQSDFVAHGLAADKIPCTQ